MTNDHKHNSGDLVYIPANVSLLKETEFSLPTKHSVMKYISQTITTNEPEYALIIEYKKSDKYIIFWNGENWIAAGEDIFPLDYSNYNKNKGNQSE